MIPHRGQDRRGRRGQCLRLCLAATIAGVAGASARGQAPTVVTPKDRTVHRFTFTEPDNFTGLPKYWVAFRTLPTFTLGRFDAAVGHESAPSFYLGLNGRDVAYRYVGPPFETPVRPNSDYQVVGWMRPDRLRSARAQITAFYVDREGLPIASTQVFSRLVGGEGDTWEAVSLHLSTGPREARSVGLTVRIMQEQTWRTGTKPHRYIEPTDVEGGAWFDDLVIHRLPRAVISTQVAGNVFVAPRMPTLQVVVTDGEPQGLTASVTLSDATGQEIQSDAVEVDAAADYGGTVIEYGHLAPGIYQATLRVGAGSDILVLRWRTIAFLREPYRGGTSVSRPFGVVLDGVGQVEDQLSLLSVLGVGTVKLPLWSASGAETGFAYATDALDRLLHDLVKSRVSTMSVLAGPPLELTRAAGEFPRPLLDILADNPDGWREHLSHVVAPYASVFRSWQIGGDNDPTMTDPRLLSAVLPIVRTEMKKLITVPELTVPGNAHLAPEAGKLAADNISLTIPNDVQPEWIPEHLRAYRELGYRQLGVYVEPLSWDRYDRVALLADLAKRIVYARHGGADRVFVPQPWRERATVSGMITEPTEEYVVLRTMVDLLADAELASTLNLSPEVTCLAFDSGKDAVLVLWDDAAGPEGRTHELQLGGATRQIDLWGDPTPLEHTKDGRQKVRLSPVPVFVDGVEQWLVAFLSQLRMEPDHVEFRIGLNTHIITLAAPVRESVSGTLELEAPETWDVRPRRFTFALPHGGTLRKEIQIRYANNEPAGKKCITAKVDFDSEGRYHMEVPLRFEVGLGGIEVWGFASRRGDRLIVRHGVLNRTDQVVSFRGFVAAPGRTRQYRVFNAMQPGQTVVTEYAFERGNELSGRELRLGLREVGGPRGHNLEVLAP